MTVVAVCVFAPSAALSAEFAVESGLSAHWYSPERSGEGLVLEVLDEEYALVYWFTYDEVGHQRWLFDVGTISDNEIVFPELTVSRGGKFGPDFDPDEVQFEVAGEAVLSFSSCNDAEFSYSAFGQAQTIPMTRLSQTMAAGCQPINGVPGQPVREYAGQSGSWYDPSHAGEGYTLHWLSHDQALLMWFSYDADGNQYWMTGMGDYEDGRIEFPELFATHGARFGEAFESGDVEFDDWGSLTLDLECLSGSAVFESRLPEFGAGEFDLSRLTMMARPDCPWEEQSLKDLYEFHITEIDFRPLADDSAAVLRDVSFTANDVAENGDVVGYRTSNQDTQIFTWSSDDGEFFLSERGMHRSDVFIRPDASYAIATKRSQEVTSDSASSWQPVWASGGEPPWSLVPNIQVESSIVYGISNNGLRLVGTARDSDSNSFPWVWEEQEGQLFLSVDAQMAAGVPRAVSDDGQTIVGNQGGLSSSGVRTDYATRWTAPEEPAILRNDEGVALAWSLTCNATCDVVPGSLHGGDPDLEEPGAFRFWLWTEKNGFQYIESSLPGAIDRAIPPSRLALDTTADGSLFVGRYLVEIAGARTERPVIWTQATGVEALYEVLENVEGWDENWGDIQAVAVSQDGRWVLLSGEYLTPPEPVLGRYGRAMLLELTLK